MKSFSRFSESRSEEHHPTLVVLKKHSVTDTGEVLYELKSPVGRKQRSRSKVVIDPPKPA